MKIEMIQELTGRYMKITVEEKAGDFGERILRYNQIDGILGAQVCQVDNKPQYLYRIGDWISLSELFRKGRLAAEDVKQLMRLLIELFQGLEKYLLDERDLVLISDYMFYDEKERRLFVSYLDGYGGDVGKGVSKLLETCMDHMDHHDKELVFLVYGLHKITKGKHFCLSQLTDFLGGSESRQEMPKSLKSLPVDSERRKPSMEQQINKKSAVPCKKKRGWQCYVKIAAYVAAGILVFIAVFYCGLLVRPSSGEPDMLKVAVLALAIVLFEGYVIGKEWAGENREESYSEDKMEEDPTTVLVDAQSDETVVLDEGGPHIRHVDLIPEDWHREEIHIRKSPFYIGKSDERADGIICEGEISRVHAKFVVEEDGVFLIDQESTNGTYVNGIRLLPWERRKIDAEDKIGFSSIYYHVEVKG